MELLKHIEEARTYIRKQYQGQPQFGIILGTGLGKLADEITVSHEIAYKDIPHFPLSTVEFHSGKLIFGKLGGKEVVAMKGRFHYYEGYSMQQVTFPVRVLKALGIEKLFISNAAGGVNPAQEISELMIINDHISLFPDNPLRGPGHADLGPRFPDMSDAYDRDLIDKALKIAQKHNIRCSEGVYVGVPGPNLETPAEYRYVRTIGGDAVGMSTIPENIVARQMGIPVFAISVITDLGVDGKIKQVSVEDVLAAAYKAEPGMTLIMKELIASL
jgi:purine-nucleoside phosphorylase